MTAGSATAWRHIWYGLLSAQIPVGPEFTEQLKSLTIGTDVITFERGFQSADFSLRIRSPVMSPVISAALAYLAAWFQSRHAMQLEILALRHQLAVYQHSVKRPQLQPSDRLFWAWLSRLWQVGKRR